MCLRKTATSPSTFCNQPMTYEFREESHPDSVDFAFHSTHRVLCDSRWEVRRGRIFPMVSTKFKCNAIELHTSISQTALPGSRMANRAEQHGSQHALIELDSSLGPEIKTYTQPAGPLNPRVQSEACFEQRATTGRQSYRSWPQCFLHGIYGFREVTHSAGFCQNAARRQQERVLFNHQWTSMLWTAMRLRSAMVQVSMSWCTWLTPRHILRWLDSARRKGEPRRAKKRCLCETNLESDG